MIIINLTYIIQKHSPSKSTLRKQNPTILNTNNQHIEAKIVTHTEKIKIESHPSNLIFIVRRKKNIITYYTQKHSQLL